MLDILKYRYVLEFCHCIDVVLLNFLCGEMVVVMETSRIGMRNELNSRRKKSLCGISGSLRGLFVSGLEAGTFGSVKDFMMG